MSDLPPVAKRIPKTLTLHAHERTDPYYWMRKEVQEAQEYLNSEGRYADQWMQGSASLAREIEAEIRSRIVPDEVSVPYRDGRFWYFRRYEPNQDYPIYCRSVEPDGSDAEVILDVNQLASTFDYFDLGDWQVSPDDRWLAYAFDTDGSEIYSIAFFDLSRRERLPEVIQRCTADFVWDNHSKVLYYVRLSDDKKRRASTVKRHELGTHALTDATVYEEQAESFSVQLSKTKSKRYILVHSWTTNSTETRYLDADEPESHAPHLFLARESRHEYSVDHLDSTWIIRTNHEAPNFRLMRSDGASDKGNWAELIPHRDDLFLEPSFELLAEHVVVMERGDGLVRLSVCPQRGGPPHLIPFEEPVYEISLADNYEPDSRWLRFVYSSLTTPASTYDYDVVTRERILRKTKAVSEGFSPSSYRSERLWAVADDGTRIPISLVYHEDRPRDGGGPLLLTGYGAEASSSDADFDSARLSLLDRGFAFAIAHVRGGAELGHSWYEQARQLQKKNTFTDFIACAEYLVREKITSPNRLCVYGASAGGTLAAVVAGMRPDLFQAVVAEVPFVDVVTTMADESIPWVTEQRDEWGDPTTDQRLYRYMLEYSPYDQVENKAYPHLLVTVAANDPNVMFWEATKWVAKLRHERTDDKVLLLRPIDSHQGNPGRLKQVPDVAFMYAFLVRLAAESFTRNAAPD